MDTIVIGETVYSPVFFGEFDCKIVIDTWFNDQFSIGCGLVHNGYFLSAFLWLSGFPSINVIEINASGVLN